MSPRLAGTARVAALALLWGSGFLWIKIGLDGFSPIQITLFRMALGAAVLLGILQLRGLRLPRDRTTWMHLTVAAFFGNTVPYLLFSIGEQTVSSATAGVINASTPLWTVLITVFAYQNGIAARRNAWSLIIGFAGVLLIFSPWNHASEIASWGGLACLIAAASYGISYVYIGKFLVAKDLGVLRMATGQLICATAITLATVPLFGWTEPQWTLAPTLAVFILGALGTGIAYILNYRIITDDGPTAASIIVYLLPVVAVILGVTVLDETVDIQTVGGTIAVLWAAQIKKPDINLATSTSIGSFNLTNRSA
jgi:drug/metabolite transporter (DMT)-like permease